MAVARPVVPVPGAASVIEVSLFSVVLVAAMLVGADTDYAIFLLGRYQEGRRRGRDRVAARADAYWGVAPVIIGSAMTLSVALAAWLPEGRGIPRLSQFRCPQWPFTVVECDS
jgi:putative drug exporter of the RND superfamily